MFVFQFHANVDGTGNYMIDGFSVEKVMSMKFSTFDVVLGTAFFATLAFAVYQVYQWCAIKAKSMGIGHDYTPLHDI